MALDLPADVREAIARWGEEVLARLPDLRRVGETDLHVTLAFLGWRPAEQASQIWDIATAAVSGLALPRLEPGAVVPVPRRRPRLLALDLADPDGAAAGWYSVVSGALAQAGLYEPEKRPFWAHATVARGRKGARVRSPEAGPALAPFTATALTLYRSDLSPCGARYTALERLSG